MIQRMSHSATLKFGVNSDICNKKKHWVEPHEIDEEEFIPSTDQDCRDLESSDESVTRSQVNYSQDEEELITKHFEKLFLMKKH